MTDDMTLSYTADMELQLWVRDTGSFDSIAIFVNGKLSMLIADSKTHKFPISRPPESVVVAVHFGGNDGGYSAIVDVKTGKEDSLSKLGPDDGFRHSFILKAA